MAIKGLVTFWGADTTKMRGRLTEIRSILSRCKMNPLLKKDAIEGVDIVIRLLQKGKAHAENDTER